MNFHSTAARKAYACSVCDSLLEPNAKFCGTCGTVLAGDSFNFAAHGVKASAPVPSFAPVSPRRSSRPSPELQTEAGKLLVLLARERLFLYMHWLIFIGVNLFGFWLAGKCYHGYIADPVTRLMMATTPLLYINSLSLLCIVPIKGTRREIAKLKEKLNYVKFQVEYNHLL